MTYIDRFRLNEKLKFGQRCTVRVTIRISDINDNTPIITNQKPIQFTAKCGEEESIVGTITV